MSHKIKTVIDTNIFLICISRKSKAHWIFQKIINKDIELCISNDILTEYEEILTKKLPDEYKNSVIDLLTVSTNIIKIIPYFKWNLITSDPDDNKFVDCAVAGNVDYLVTNDKHFDVLKSIDFPKVNVINIDEFKALFF